MCFLTFDFFLFMFPNKLPVPFLGITLLELKNSNFDRAFTLKGLKF